MNSFTFKPAIALGLAGATCLFMAGTAQADIKASINASTNNTATNIEAYTNQNERGDDTQARGGVMVNTAVDITADQKEQNDLNTLAPASGAAKTPNAAIQDIDASHRGQDIEATTSGSSTTSVGVQ